MGGSTGTGAPARAGGGEGSGPRLARAAATALLALGCCHLVAVFALAPVLPEDDAFITLRYAANLGSGRGLVYNAGERVLGTTSPLQALVLAGAAALAGKAALPAAALWLNCVAALATALLTISLLRALAVPETPARLAGAWLVLSPSLITVALGGMDTCLLSCLAVGSWCAAAARRWATAAGVAALSCVARPEGGIVLLVVLVAWARSGAPQRRRVAAWAAAPLLAWGTFATAYYGSPIPQSLRAKLAPLYVPPRGEGAAAIARVLGEALFGSGRPAAVAAGVALALALACAAAATPRAGALAHSVVLYLGLVVAEFVLGNPGWAPWYAGLVLVPFAVAAFLGLDTLVRVGARAGAIAAAAASAPAWVLVVAAAIGDAGVTALPNWPATGYGVFTPYRLRTVAYRDAGGWIARREARGATVLGSEIGMLGFTLPGCRLVDADALVTPEAQRFLPVTTAESPFGGAIAPELVRATMPDYVVSLPVYAGLLRADPGFRAAYALAGTFRGGGAGGELYRVDVFGRTAPDAARHAASAAGNGSSARSKIPSE